MDEALKVWNYHIGSAHDTYYCPIKGCNNIIVKNDHCNGNNHGLYGVWEQDHEYPDSKGGSDRLSNVRPICCRCNREKGASTSGKWS